MISVIIPTYNRFIELTAAVQSVREQTFKDVEIIVVNDGSTQKEYYENKIEGATVIHLATNSRAKFGFPCAGYVRNQGARLATGRYLAFLDDDDVWRSDKLETQLRAIESSGGGTAGPKMCATEAYFCDGPPPVAPLCLYNKEKYIDKIADIFASAGRPKVVNRKNGFPPLFTHDMIKIHNCIITSSVLISKDIFNRIGGFNHFKNGEEDYDMWLQALIYTHCVYVDKPCLIYTYSAQIGKHV